MSDISETMRCAKPPRAAAEAVETLRRMNELHPQRLEARLAAATRQDEIDDRRPHHNQVEEAAKIQKVEADAGDGGDDLDDDLEEIEGQEHEVDDKGRLLVPLGLVVL